MERKHIYIVCALILVLALLLAAVLYIRFVKNAEPSAIDTLLEASSVAFVDPLGNPVNLAGLPGHHSHPKNWLPSIHWLVNTKIGE